MAWQHVNQHDELGLPPIRRFVVSVARLRHPHTLCTRSLTLRLNVDTCVLGPKTDDVAWTGVAKFPVLSKYSYLLPSHHAQVCERWARQHTNGLQHAFFMGRGFVPWENVWGIFNAVNEGDGEALRRVRPLLTFAASLNLTIGAHWTPFAPEITASTVASQTNAVEPDADDAIVASRFEPSGAVGNRLWLLVNRRARSSNISSSNTDVALFSVSLASSTLLGQCFFDLYRGENITMHITTQATDQAGTATAEFHLEVDPMDYGAVGASM